MSGEDCGRLYDRMTALVEISMDGDYNLIFNYLITELNYVVV
jgi:hypothetical protein